MFFKQNQTNIVLLVILAMLIYMPIFGHLGSLPIRIWDEARLSINAYEMWKNNNFIVTYFEGKPDMWNTKPPLMIWAQVVCIKIFGYNEIAVRLPSAIAALFTCVIIMVFSVKYLKSYLFGAIAIMVLITTAGYIDIHATRTADYDSLLTMFLVLSSLLFFSYIEAKKNKYIYMFFISLALAVLTKSVAGLFFTPALLIYTIVRKEFVNILKNKHFYFGFLVFLGMVLAYYIAREILNPGYVKSVIDNEIFFRYIKTTEGHSYPFSYFYYNIVREQFQYWIILFPVGVITCLFVKDVKFKRIYVFSVIIVIMFFLIISSSMSKLYWYSIPLFPFMAIIVSLFIYTVFQYIKSIQWFNDNFKINIIPYVLLFFIFIKPFVTIIDKTYLPKEKSWDVDFYEIEYFLQDATKGLHDLNGKFLLYEGYYAQNLFYIKMLHEKGINTDLKDWNKLEIGDIIYTATGSIKEFIQNNYKFETIKTDGNVITYKILEKNGNQ